MTELQELELIPFEDPEFYVNNPEPVYQRLQEQDPIHYYEPLDVFVLTKLKHIREAAKRADVFTSGQGLFLNELRIQKDHPEMQSPFADLFPEGGEQFAFADPPRHGQLRGKISPSFVASNLEDMKPSIEQFVAELLAKIEPDQRFDFVAEVADLLPIMVAKRLMGVTEATTDEVKYWSDGLENMNAAETPEQVAAAKTAFQAMNDFFVEEFERQRANPQGGMVSALLETELDGAPVSEPTLLTYCTTILAAGSDTTRALLTGTMLAFADHPDQFDRLRNDRSLIPTAIEECIRWVTPARSFLRTAMSDIEIGGQEIKAGQRVFLLYAAGNFDAEVFPDPYTFDVGREQGRQHLGFGFGPHTCIAAALIRIEMAIFLTQLLDRFSRIERAGEPTAVVHVLRHSWEDAPLVCRA